jgi:hypothetical protein
MRLSLKVTISFCQVMIVLLALALPTIALLSCKTSAAEPSDTIHDCEMSFPPGEWRSLLGDSAGKKSFGFRQLEEKNKSPGGWSHEGGSLVAKQGKAFQSLISNCKFLDFELEFEWIISPGGNSGIKYLVSSDPGPRFAKGLEYQILDDVLHPDARIGENRTAGALYDLIPPAENKKLNPPGRINQSRIIFARGKGEHWLNGEKVLAFDMDSKEFAQNFEKSKFKAIAGFVAARSGHILIQHHDDKVEFLKIRIKSGHTR